MDMFEEMRDVFWKISLIQSIFFYCFNRNNYHRTFIPLVSNFNGVQKYNSEDIAWINKEDEGLGWEVSQREENIYKIGRLLIKNNGVLTKRKEV